MLIKTELGEVLNTRHIVRMRRWGDKHMMAFMSDGSSIYLTNQERDRILRAEEEIMAWEQAYYRTHATSDEAAHSRRGLNGRR